MIRIVHVFVIDGARQTLYLAFYTLPTARYPVAAVHPVLKHNRRRDTSVYIEMWYHIRELFLRLIC